jgi:hypothetical protein
MKDGWPRVLRTHFAGSTTQCDDVKPSGLELATGRYSLRCSNLPHSQRSHNASEAILRIKRASYRKWLHGQELTVRII